MGQTLSARVYLMAFSLSLLLPLLLSLLFPLPLFLFSLLSASGTSF